MPPKQQQTNGKSSAPVKKDTGGGASSKGKTKKKKWSKGKVDDNPNNLVGSVQQSDVWYAVQDGVTLQADHTGRRLRTTENLLLFGLTFHLTHYRSFRRWF